MFVELDSHDQIVGFIFLPIRDDCFVFFFFSNPIAMIWKIMSFVVLSYQAICVLMYNRVDVERLQQSMNFPKWNRHGFSDPRYWISQDYSFVHLKPFSLWVCITTIAREYLSI